MPKAPASRPALDAPFRRAHFAARVEDGIHAFRVRRGLARGLVPTIVPFTGYAGDGWLRVLARVLLQKPPVGDAGRARAVRGWRSFTSAHVRDADVTVIAGGQEHAVRADRGGVLDARIAASLEPGWTRVKLRLGSGDAVEAPVFVVDERVDFGIVSDVDDTVMVTALPRPLLAAWNTFVLDEHARSPVPGMAVLYERLTRAHPGAPVFYLSTGAWNVAPTMARFLHRNLYPRGPILLTDWGPTHDRWFRSGTEHKRGSLARLAAEFPRIRWLLIGDDGQHDEALYREFTRAHPDRVAAVAIRRLTPGEAVFAGGRKRLPHDDEPVPWLYASDGAGLDARLRELGLLGG